MKPTRLGTRSSKALFATSASRSMMRSASRSNSSSDLSTSAALSLAGPLSVHAEDLRRRAWKFARRAESGPSSLPSHESVEQCLCLFQIGGIEPLGKPAVDGRQQFVRLGPAALFTPKPGEIGRGTQFERFCLLPPGDPDCLPQQTLAPVRGHFRRATPNH